MSLKRVVREILMFLNLDVTKNLEYDRLTKYIFKELLTPSSNCIDVGCHKGEILDCFIRLAPKGKHFAFEPIPHLYLELKEKFPEVAVFPYALGNEEGESSFQYVKNAPAYSGIKRRKYDVENPEIEELKIEVKRLDDLIPDVIKIDVIKIDVEGGEFDVLKGAKKTLQKNLPTVIFEFGKGAGDYYGTKPEEILDFLTKEIGLDIYTLKDFVKKGQKLSKESFISCFEDEKEYYFVAHNSSR